MANRDSEHVESIVDTNARIHDEALARSRDRNHLAGEAAPPSNPSPSDSLRASERLGPRGVSDASLNWAGGRYTSSQGWNDTPMTEVGSTGLGVSSIKATPPDQFDHGVTPVADHSEGSLNMDGISGTRLGNPGVIKERR